LTLAICAVCAGLQPDGWSQPTAGQVFRAEARTVVVHATVQDADGRLLTDLSQDEFQILDDARPVKITQFSTDKQPLRVAIMLDASWSAGRFAGSLVTALRAFTAALRPDEGVKIGTFGAEIAVGADLTNDPAEVERVLREEYWTGNGVGTPLWQAIGEGVASLANETGRRVVLVFSDGHDSGRLPGWEGSRSDVAEEVSRLDGMVYIVRPPLSRIDAAERPLPRTAIDFVETTGGGYYAVPIGTDIKDAFEQIAAELRHQYVLGFIPTVLDGREHKIQVGVTRPGARVRSRKTYYTSKERW